MLHHVNGHGHRGEEMGLAVAAKRVVVLREMIMVMKQLATTERAMASMATIPQAMVTVLRMDTALAKATLLKRLPHPALTPQLFQHCQPWPEPALVVCKR